MSFRTTGYLTSVVLEISEERRAVLHKLFWIAVCIAFLIANAPPARISALLLQLLQHAPQRLTTTLFHQNTDLRSISTTIVYLVVIPIKKLFFFLALVVISFPIIRSLSHSKSFWYKLGLGRIGIAALLMFFALSLFTFPYSYPNGLHSHRSGLSGVGMEYGRMSADPFSHDSDVFYGRLLKPAVGHFIHMDGYVRYYLFSLLCTYGLLFLTIAFLESKLLFARTDFSERRDLPDPKLKWLVYLSVLTSSFIMTSFQWPGYPENLAFILTLLMATAPMTPYARLGIIALCILTHDGSALALIPVILFCLPKVERLKACLLMGLFGGIALASYGFDLNKGLEGHGSILEEGSVWENAIASPHLFLAGWCFSYKLLWIVFAYVVWRLWTQKDKWAAIALPVIIAFPVFLTLIAWDTTRIAGFGFLAMLIATVTFLHEQRGLSRSHYFSLLAVIYINIVIPPYNVILLYPDTVSTYPYRGLYMLLHSAVRSLLY